VAPDNTWVNLCPLPPVRGVTRAAQRRACLQPASNPDVPFCVVARCTEVVVRTRNSVLGGVMPQVQP
jgi:hypothetical protein